MDFPISGLSSALAGIKTCMRRLDQAADVVAQTTPGGPAATPHGPAGEEDPVARAEATGLVGAMADVLIAQRAFSAQMHLMRTARAMAQDAEQLPGK